MKIRVGKPGDIIEIMNIIKEAIKDMETRGIRQWDDLYVSVNEINLIQGIIVLNEHQDTAYKAIKWKYNLGRQLILHRLCIHPLYQGKGIARMLIKFAEDFGSDRKYESIRLDAFIPNIRACRMYEKLGYDKKEIVTLRKGDFYCYEKKLFELNYKVKQITSLYDSCDKCGLPIINCLCDKVPKIKTDAKIWILSTEKEFYRPSNTARLLALVNPTSTEIFLWERTRIPEKLVTHLNSNIYEPFLLFPIENYETESRKVEYKNTKKIPAFIILDGTWKEARKIFRRSSYLENLPIISLEPTFKSIYDLRRGAKVGNLCTIEAAIEVLKINSEIKNAQIVNEFYNLFLKSYKAGSSGHKLTPKIENATQKDDKY